jgi:hypothetical protein
LYGSFCGVAAVNVRWDALEIHFILGERLFKVVGTFVVEDVKSGCIAIGL